MALDADTLRVLDHWQNPGPGPDDNSDSAADGTRLVGSANKDGWLYVLRREQLARGPLWKYRLAVGGKDPLQGQGSLVAPTFANGLLYAAGGITEDGAPGTVVALEPLDGTVRWKYTPPGYVFAGMPALGEVLVVVSNALDGSLRSAGPHLRRALHRPWAHSLVPLLRPASRPGDTASLRSPPRAPVIPPAHRPAREPGRRYFSRKRWTVTNHFTQRGQQLTQTEPQVDEAGPGGERGASQRE